MKALKLSIVTPSFRSADWLKLCIASVADQENAIFEHIIQDSCSDDGTLNWLPKDARVTAFIEKDDGMYDAVNRGLRRATGDICAYLNCDEQYLPGTLAKVTEFFRDHPAVDMVFGDIILIDKNGEPLSYRRTILPTLRHVQLAHLNTPSCSIFFRRKLLDRGFYFDPALKDVGDAAWMENLLKKKVSMATISESLAAFTLTGTNRSILPSAIEEAAKRKKRVKATPLQHVTTIAGHRLRKAVAGAYRKRTVSISIYTQDSPNARRQFTSKVGFSWPE